MSCSQTLSGIARDCAPSMGGIKVAYIANFDDVATKTLTDGKISGITMNSTAKFKKYHFRPGTGSVTSTLNADPANGVNYVSSEIALQFNKMETTKRVEMAALAVNELVVIIEDNNGTLWLYGYDEGVCASAGDGTTGTARGDANKYGITLLDNAKTWPYEVEASVLSTIL